MRIAPSHRLSVAVCLMVWVTGCQEAGPAGTQAASGTDGSVSAPLGLSLRAEARDPGGVVTLVYRAAAGRPGPRVAEIWLQPSDGLRLTRATAGTATTAAGKRLVAQQEDGRVRLVIYSSDNVLRVDSGVLARLTFAGEGTVALVNRRPVFAPPDAERGIRIGPPVTVGGR